MSDRALNKPGDFSLGQAHEFVGAFGRQGGTPVLLQKMIENSSLMADIVGLIRGRELHNQIPSRTELSLESLQAVNMISIRKADECLSMSIGTSCTSGGQLQFLGGDDRASGFGVLSLDLLAELFEAITGRHFTFKPDSQEAQYWSIVAVED